MARAELPSKQPDGSANWVEFRDRLSFQDRIAANSAIVFTFTADPSDPEGKREIRKVTGANDERMKAALAARLITAWSFPGVPVPSQNIADPEQLLDSTLDLDDWDKLAEEIDPLFRRILRSGPKPPEKPAGTENPEIPSGT